MEQTQHNQNNFAVPLAIIIAGILIAGAVIYSAGKTPSGREAVIGNGSPQAPGTQLGGSTVDIKNVDTNNEPYIGNPNAPVTLAYWFDFQCPFCKRFEQQSLPTLVDRYVKTGKLRIVFKDFQFLGPDSQDAGLAANAIWELYPNQYEEWQNAMFGAQDGENSGFGNLDSVLALIRDKVPGINADKVAARVNEKRTAYQQELDGDRAEGSQFGISGTPGFVIGTQTISGAQPTSVFTQIIDAELRKK